MEIGNNYSSSIIDPTILQKMASDKSITEEQKINKLCNQFESVLFQQFLGDAMKPIFEDGLFNEDKNAQDIQRYFFVNVLSEKMAGYAKDGFASSLQNQLLNGRKISDLREIV